MAIVDRSPTPRIDLQEAFQPRAEIVDAYVRPATPDKSPLWDLAEGLQVFSSSLKGLMDGRKAQDAAHAAALGEAAFYKSNSTGYAEAVRQGLIPSFQSPEFVSGYKKAEGALIGKRMAAAFELEYSTWDGRNGQDPAAFDGFVADFVQRHLTTDDPDVLSGALPYVRQLTERGYSLNVQERADGLYNNSIDAHIAGSDQDFDWAVQAGTASGDGPDMETLWEALTANREAALSTGIRDEDYDKKLIDLVIFKAQENGDTRLLSLLDNKVPGHEYSYAETQYGREQLAAAEASIETAKRTAEERNYTAQQRADKAMRDQMEAFVIEKLAENPQYEFDEKFLTEYAKYDPQARINVRDWGRKLAEGAPEDEEAVLGLYDRILKGEDPSVVIRHGMDSGIIRTPATLKGLQGFKTSEQDVSRYRSNSVFKSALGALRQAATPEQEFYNPEAASPAAVAVQLDFEKAMTRFLAENPDASDIQISEEAARVYGILSKGITDLGQYATPTEVGVDQNPLVQSQQQVEQQAAEQAAFEASPEGQMDVWAGDAPPALDTLPPEERKALEEAAGAMGIDPAILTERTWQKVNEILDGANPAGAPEGPVVEPSTPAPHPNLTGTPQGETDRDTVSLLDLVGDREGTDRGASYDETFGYGAYTGGPVQLTAMSIGEVRDLQQEMVAHPDNAYRSGAVGRYQIMPATLADMQRKLGLPDDTPFTPEVQDRMALALLDRRGLRQFLKGSLSAEEFLDNLGKEWVSLRGADPTLLAFAPEAVPPEMLDGLASQAAVNESAAGGSPLDIAQAYLGYDERNPKQAKALAAFFKKAGGLDIDPTTTAWCAAFLNAVLGEAGFEGTGKATARSFLKVGVPVDKPSPGDIVVFERGPKGGWQGHVGIVASVHKDGSISVLGGNQSSDDSGARGVTVNVKTFGTERVLGYRRINRKAARTLVASTTT